MLLCACTRMRTSTGSSLGSQTRRASNGFARACFTSAAGNQPGVLLHSVFNSACTVDGRIAARTASVRTCSADQHCTLRRPRLHCAGHACSSCCTSGITAFVDQRRSLRPLTRLQLGLRWSSCCARSHQVYMRMQWNTRGNHRSVCLQAQRLRQPR